MSHLYTFSPLSEANLQRCLAAASQPDLNNKWYQLFGNKNKTENHSQETAILQEDSFQPVEIPFNLSNTDEDVTELSEEFYESIESEHTINIKLLTENCTSNQTIIAKLAERITAHTFEKIIKHLYTDSSVNKKFLEHFIVQSFPVVIKKQYSITILDLLVELDKKFPDIFRSLLEILLKDPQIPKNVLNDFVQAVNAEKHTIFMENLTFIELTAKEFVDNLFTIYAAYKNCEKTERIQKYIMFSLKSYNAACKSEQNYGRLFLAYLQAESGAMETVDFDSVEQLLESHMTPFKRPCLVLVKRMKEQCEET